VTISEKVTCIEIEFPELYVPSVVLEVTLVTVGAVVSTMSALLAAREPAPPGLARVREAALPTPSLIVPALRAKAPVD
jgi:hypothetical protein